MSWAYPVVKRWGRVLIEAELPGVLASDSGAADERFRLSCCAEAAEACGSAAAAGDVLFFMEISDL